MLKLALTGGLASGKSTVAELLRARGVPVFDADAAAKDVAREQMPALTAAFGAAASDPHALADLVFADPAKLARLNQIMHPAIMARARARLDAWEREGKRAAAVDAALLIEARLLDGFARIILVVADQDTRILRFMARTGASKQQAEARIAQQLPDAEKLCHADFVIRNNGTIADLTVQVDALLQNLLKE